MLLKIVIVLVVLVAGFLIVAAMQPAEFRVTRTATLNAPATSVFAQVNDFHKWEAWSPFAKMDPAAKNTFAGAASGPGAEFSWDGNNKIGSGHMTILESRPNELIKIKLDFSRPIPANNLAEFTFKPEGSRTTVTWTMSGKNNLVGKAIGLVMNCDKMVGPQFEQGLHNIEAVSQAAAKS
jgi:uncharacterized protein YndB with AHSA1/START domain